MLNERKLTERELDKRSEAIKGLLSNKRKLVQKYGKDAEKVMYGIATKQAKKKVEKMNLDNLKELIKKSLQQEIETTPSVPNASTAVTKNIDTGFSGRADYGEEDKALGREDELEMRGLEEGHGLSQKDIDILKRGFNTFFVSAPKYGEMEEFKRVIKFLLKSNILQDKTKDLSKGKVDENLIKEFIGGETEKRISVLFDKLVPGSGNADTVEGEIIRALNRLIYRWGNDGDLFWSGYGAETAGPAMEYLTDASDIPFEIREKFKAWENDNFGKDYDKGELIDLAQIALQHVEIKVKEDDLTKNEDDLFNYGQKYIDHVRDMEEEEDEYDDYYDDDDDEFMNEGHMMPMDDLDVGHTDNEPHMLKKELARAGQMVQMLYRAVDKYDGQGEVDFPQWWQKKIIQANAMLDSAFDYIDGEEMVAKIDAMIDNMDTVEVDIDVVNEEEDIKKRLDAEKAIRKTLKDEGGAAGLKPLVKAVKKFGFNKDELIKLLRKTVQVDKHKHGDYILTPINEKVTEPEEKKLKKIEKELNKASKMHKSQADRIAKIVKEKLTTGVEEKKLTAAEKRKKEDIIMALKKQKGGKKKLEPVDYAVATDRAKKLAEKNEK